MRAGARARDAGRCYSQKHWYQNARRGLGGCRMHNGPGHGSGKEETTRGCPHRNGACGLARRSVVQSLINVIVQKRFIFDQLSLINATRCRSATGVAGVDLENNAWRRSVKTPGLYRLMQGTYLWKRNSQGQVAYHGLTWHHNGIG